MLKCKRIASGLVIAAAMTGLSMTGSMPGVAFAQSASTPATKGMDIVIDDPNWEKLSEAQRAELVNKLKAANAIGVDDRIVFRGKADNRITEKNTNPMAALPMVGASVCRVANLMRRSSCGKIENAGQRKSCQDEEKARYTSSSVKSACGG
jgi:hypothetical protein